MSLLIKLGYNPNWKDRKGKIKVREVTEGEFEGEIDGEKVKIKTVVGTEVDGYVEDGKYSGEIKGVLENKVEEIE